MPHVTIPFSPRLQQAELIHRMRRFNVWVCHRRLGKSVLAINVLIRKACEIPNARLAYISPTQTQSKDIAWDYLKHYTAPIPDVKLNETELRADFPWGSRIRLYGADNPHRVRGLGLHGAVLDEYEQMNPIMWSQVVRPALADHRGFCIFLGTPMGMNQFYDMYEGAAGKPEWMRSMYKASETGIVPDDELEAAREEMGEDVYLQEFECSWSAAIRGAYYGREMREAREEGRIGEVPYDRAYPCDTWWDLGLRHSTVIWITQALPGGRINCIDIIHGTGLELSDYAQQLFAKPYVYRSHIGPHDLATKHFPVSVSSLDVASNLGIHFTVAEKLSVMQGIDAARRMLKRCWFDQEKCYDGIRALEQYRAEYNPAKGNYSLKPSETWASDFCDAFRMGAITPVASSLSIPWNQPLNDGFYASEPVFDDGLY